MARSVEPDEEIWGTREELLLAGAVGRHGAENWESVAMEVQKRSPVATALVTAQSCEKRFLFLQRRFRIGKNGAQSDVVFLLEELRKLRVAELRREVERYDVSILSLQLKVKELTADRDRSVSPEQSDGGGAPDRGGAAAEEKASAENGDGGRSSNESNSPGRKLGGEDSKLGGEGSYNGSSDTVAKCAEAATPADGAPPPCPPRRGGDSGESMAESKGEETSEADVVSQPWSSFLETLLSAELGPSFERRLQTQETAEYASLIRQHMDLSTVRRKMAEGFYVADAEFYRDLTLLYTNAVVFFVRDSPEHEAALHLRRLVLERARAAAGGLRTRPAATVPEEGPSLAVAPTTAALPEELPAEKTGNSAKEEEDEEEEMEEEKEDNDETDEEEKMERNRAKERAAVAAVRRTRTGKGRRKAAKKRSPPAGPPADEVDDDDSAGSGKSDMKNGAAAAAAVAAVAAAPAAKKRSAVNFLSRINRNGMKAEETLKAAGRGKKGVGESKDPGVLPLKRGVGRPPKRPPPPPPSSPPPAPAPPPKRGRPAEADPPRKKRRRR
ncbi:uncharacterized protein LOC144713242 [Wolffia australiana]